MATLDRYFDLVREIKDAANFLRASWWHVQEQRRSPVAVETVGKRSVDRNRSTPGSSIITGHQSLESLL